MTSYRVRIRRKGFPAHNTSFDDLEEAKAFVRRVLMRCRVPHPDGRIWAVSGNQLKKAFEYARERAAAAAKAMGRSDLEGNATLRWHDLRHEATSCCFDAVPFGRPSFPLHEGKPRPT